MRRPLMKRLPHELRARPTPMHPGLFSATGQHRGNSAITLQLAGAAVAAFTGSSLDFVLTGLGPGSSNTNCAGVIAVGESCAALGSPFLLTYNGVNQTTVTLAANGTVTDGGVISTWSGAFSTQVDLSAVAIQATEGAGGSIASTQSAEFNLTVTTPEPGTATMLLVGGVALLGIGRRRFRKG